MGEIERDISFKNSILLAMTLERLFSHKDTFESFVADINRSTESKSIHKYIWGTELDEQSRIISRLGFENILNSIESNSNAIELLDIRKKSNKIMDFKVHVQHKTEFIPIECIRKDKFLYHKIGEENIPNIIAEPNSDVWVPRFTLLKLMCTSKYFGIMKNARLKMPNTYFPKGIQTPYDILNRCTFVNCDDAQVIA